MLVVAAVAVIIGVINMDQINFKALQLLEASRNKGKPEVWAIWTLAPVTGLI